MRVTVLISIVFICFAGPSLAADSPIDKGSVKLSGSFLFANLSGDIYGDIAAFAVTPGIEIFTASKASFGLTFIYLNMNTDSDYGQYDVSGWGLGSALGFYFGDSKNNKSKGKTYPYGKVFVNYLKGTIDEVGGSIVQVGLKGGVDIMITETTALDFGAQYSLDSYKEKDTDSTKGGRSFWLNGGLSVYLF